MIIRTANRISGNENQVPPWLNRIHSQPYRLAQLALDAIANNRIANPAADREAKAAVRQLVGKDAQHQKFVGIRPSRAANFLEPLVLPNSIPLFHAPTIASNLSARGCATVCSSTIRSDASSNLFMT